MEYNKLISYLGGILLQLLRAYFKKECIKLNAHILFFLPDIGQVSTSIDFPETRLWHYQFDDYNHTFYL